MSFFILANAPNAWKERADLIAYLKQANKSPQCRK